LLSSQPRKIPEQEDHKLTPATRLLEKRREMLEVENGLTAQKEDFANKMETLAQRRQDLGKKESQLKESLLKFEKFLKVGFDFFFLMIQMARLCPLPLPLFKNRVDHLFSIFTRKMKPSEPEH
jgi:hypothetical protein